MPSVAVVGSGPNGLTAAIVLQSHGIETTIYESDHLLGGGLRTSDAFDGYRVDDCSAVHPIGRLSPIFNAFALEKHGLEWCYPEHSVAHPLPGGRGSWLTTSPQSMAESVRVDAQRYQAFIGSLVPHTEEILRTILAPFELRLPSRAVAEFGLKGLVSAERAIQRFQGEEARALFAGCAAHSTVPLDRWGTSAVGLVFLLAGHTVAWPVAKGGSASIARALEKVFRTYGGKVITKTRVDDARALLAQHDAVLFAVSPRLAAAAAKDLWPARYHNRLGRYVWGPSVFKIDYALSGPIPWASPAARRASTVHVGGTAEEIARSEKAAWDGEHSEAPFLIVCQQSVCDPTRAPAGRHTAYAYCHVPFSSPRDMTPEIERQIERFAPGFRDCVLARKTSSPPALEALNPSNFGGTITGGAATLDQVFFRPTFRLRPYTTPHPRLFLGSHSTPPGGGAHGMCGLGAAKAILRAFHCPWEESRLRG